MLLAGKKSKHLHQAVWQHGYPVVSRLSGDQRTINVILLQSFDLINSAREGRSRFFRTSGFPLFSLPILYGGVVIAMAFQRDQNAEAV